MARGTVHILGVPWRYQALGERAFRAAKEQFAEPDAPGTESHAFCHSTTRRLVFAAGHLDEETVRHEVVHAYLETLPYFRQGIGGSDELEEMFCDLISSHGPLILEQSARIYRACKR